MSSLKSWVEYIRLPATARRLHRADRRNILFDDPGAEAAIHANMEWLKRAQDRSPSGDGGVARSYSLISGWATSYPETTGYIVPTFLEYGTRYDDRDAIDRAKRMLDWLAAIQLEGGGFQGGKIDATPVVPVTFNTGQILLGLAAGVAHFGEYKEEAAKAATWLKETQDKDGCWRKNPTPFAGPGEKAYETHVSWGLFEAERVLPGNGFGEAGLKQVDWAISNQQTNGWIAKCCLTSPAKPYTHTLGYALRGIIEAYRLSGEEKYLKSALLTAEGLLKQLGADGYFPGRFKSDWTPAADYVCLTGTVQIAHCWLILFQYTHDTKFRDASLRANRFVRRTVDLEGHADIRGGVKGSYPVYGGYGRYEYLNWAAKFSIDSNCLEVDISNRKDGPKPD